ncbi:DUF4255 domain-containing protein [Streptomyces hygroscopicus]|uniref:DUF4255 domain-containing protein n=1 Tax=Streptomyces hygroscopicus TaxID=1912 RepID=UPI00082AECF7|nr:DUF4255 domain-containing protein [Streptomyces hygroscopicus]GLV75697.1 hypothetical protein Shyhy02_36970 [Streptomyces hygroscopicus subsp. hygroscopicus]
MSNGLAFATVTQALALLIANNLRPEIDIAVTVDTRRPPAEPPTEPTINVFLYQVTPNASMRATDLPTRASDGTLLKRPAAAMDLHYLISAYGEESELVGQRLIGSVVRILHEIPVLPKDVIEEAARRPYLTGSDLAESVQRVRFTPTQMDVDETSKLWGMLYQTPYVLSVCYQGSLVLVEGRERPVPAKPVERHTVRAVPFGAPGAPEPPNRRGTGEEPAEAEANPEASTTASRSASTGASTGAEAPSPAQPAKKRPAAAKTAAAKTAKATKTAKTAKTVEAAATKSAATKTTKAAAKSAASPTRVRKAVPRHGGGRAEDTES